MAKAEMASKVHTYMHMYKKCMDNCTLKSGGAYGYIRRIGSHACTMHIQACLQRDVHVFGATPQQFASVHHCVGQVHG